MRAHVNFRTKFCATIQGGGAGRPERRRMSNYEWIKNLPLDQLAEFLADNGAETADFCEDYCCESVACGDSCKYKDEKEIWVQWLKSEPLPYRELP